MNTAMQAPPQASGYADCLEAVRARLAAREAKLYGIAVLVVYVHQLERLFASAGHVNAARMLDELRNRLSQVIKPGDYFARLGDRKFVFVLSNLRNEGHALLAANKILRTAAEPVSAGGQHATRAALDRGRHASRARAHARAAHAVRGDRAARGLEDPGRDRRLHRAQGRGAGGRLGPRDPARERARARRPGHELPAEAVAAEARGRRLRGADALEPAGRRQRAAGDLHRRRRDDGSDRPADPLRLPPRAAPARRVAEGPGPGRRRGQRDAVDHLQPGTRRGHPRRRRPVVGAARPPDGRGDRERAHGGPRAQPPRADANCARWACASRSTTSAPATRRFPT